MKLYGRYLELAKVEAPNVIFGGRLGEYRYYDMDTVIDRALVDTDSPHNCPHCGRFS